MDARILSLRPTNTVHQLGVDSRVPLFNARHLLSSGVDSGHVLWIPSLPHPAAFSGVFRAAAHQRAVVGFCLGDANVEAAEWKYTTRPAAFFQEAVEAAENMEQAPPFCLHVRLPALDSTDGHVFESMQSHVTACLGVGYTSFGIDLTACPQGQRVDMVTGLLQQVFELELAVTVRLPVDGRDLSEQVNGIVRSVKELKAAGCAPDLIQLPCPVRADQELADTSGTGLAARVLAEEIVGACAPIGVAWRSAGKNPAEESGSEAVAALVGDSFLLDRLPHVSESFAFDRERVEALVYFEAVEKLARMRAHNSATRVERAMLSALGGR